jgi:O-antigen ligase
VVGLLCGVLASLFSGSRGAWLGLLVVLWPMLKYGSHMHRTTIRTTVGLVLAACVAAYALPQTGVAGRMGDAVSDVERYYSLNDSSTNVGIRLELWKASAMMIAEHPFIGVGRDAFHDELQALEREGRLQKSLALIYSTPHNDVLNTLATGGLLDLSFLLLIYGAPLAFFMRTLRHGPPAAAAPALAGLLLVICFIAFGLTDVMFWLMLTKAFYATMVCVLAGFCLAAQTPASSPSPVASLERHA